MLLKLFMLDLIIFNLGKKYIFKLIIMNIILKYLVRIFLVEDNLYGRNMIRK